MTFGSMPTNRLTRTLLHAVMPNHRKAGPLQPRDRAAPVSVRGAFGTRLLQQVMKAKSKLRLLLLRITQ